MLGADRLSGEIRGSSVLLAAPRDPGQRKGGGPVVVGDVGVKLDSPSVSVSTLTSISV